LILRAQSTQGVESSPIQRSSWATHFLGAEWMSIALLVRCIVGVTVALVMLPGILFCLWPRVLRSWFETGPDGIDAAATPAARDLIAAVRELGFEALGVKAEKTPFRPPLRELAFVAAERRCYASVGGGGHRSHLYYYTPLPTGGLVLTSNGRFPKIASPTVAQRSYPGCGVRDLLEHHHKGLASLGQRGEVIPTPAARLEATYAYYNTPEVRTALRRAGAAWLVCLILVESMLIHG
jgi:hypothetical protein